MGTTIQVLAKKTRYTKRECTTLFVPRGSYPTPFLERLLFKIADPNHKTRYPKNGVGYEPLGRASLKFWLKFKDFARRRSVQRSVGL